MEKCHFGHGYPHPCPPCVHIPSRVQKERSLVNASWPPRRVCAAAWPDLEHGCGHVVVPGMGYGGGHGVGWVVDMGGRYGVMAGYRPVHGHTGQYMAIQANTWPYTAIHGHTRPNTANWRQIRPNTANWRQNAVKWRQIRSNDVKMQSNDVKMQSNAVKWRQNAVKWRQNDTNDVKMTQKCRIWRQIDTKYRIWPCLTVFDTEFLHILTHFDTFWHILHILTHFDTFLKNSVNCQYYRIIHFSMSKVTRRCPLFQAYIYSVGKMPNDRFWRKCCKTD